MTGETDLAKLIASMTPVLTEQSYVFATLETPAQAQLAALQPLGTFMEKEGLTVIVLKQKADELNLAYQGVFRCITLTVHSSLDAVGLTAAVATRLAKVNISANVIAAYYHDHIFIAAKDALPALNELKALALEGA